MRPRIFLLSPADSGGERARLLASGLGNFELSRRLGSGERVPLGDAFAWLSALYFRGKLAYGRAFERPPSGSDGTLVITTDRGLRPWHDPVSAEDLRRFAEVPIDLAEPRYRGPLERDVAALPRDVEVVLLGSIASGKYAEVLLAHLGERLLFPPDFVGRGDLSRGGLLLRAVRAGQELPYAPLAGATRRGVRPPRLPRIR